jgi:hypothetical protein
MSDVALGQVIEGRPTEGRPLRSSVFNENEVRVAAGLTMVAGAVAFVYANFEKVFVPIRVVTIALALEFLIRLTVGLRYSPAGVVSHWMTRRQPPQWVSTKPKRFAWTMGLAMSVAMAFITNRGIHGALPRSICLTCLALMWLEAVPGICLGCELYGLLVRRGWLARDEAFEICAHGACRVVPEAPPDDLMAVADIERQNDQAGSRRPARQPVRVPVPSSVTVTPSNVPSGSGQGMASGSETVTRCQTNSVTR